MSKWPMARLGDVTTVVAGSTPRTSVEEFWNGSHCWVTPAELSDNVTIIEDTERRITDLAIKNSGLKQLPIGTVLLSSRAPIGKVAITGCVMYCNQGFKNLVCGEKIYNKYLFWLLRGKNEYLNSLGRGATFKEISKAIVENINIPLPPIAFQKYIAHVLDQTYEMIDGHKRQIEELDSLVKATFYDMFGDPLSNEKEWAKLPYKEITLGKIMNGFFTENKNYCANGNAQVIWVSDSINRLYSNVENLRSVVVTEDVLSMYSIKYGDLLFCRSSLTKEGIGKASAVPQDVPSNIMFECHLIKTSLNMGLMEPIFLQVLTTTDFFRNQIMSRSKTSTMTTVNQDGILSTVVILPPLDLQKKFAEIVTNIEQQKSLVKQSLTESQNLFNSLMSRYFD